MHTILWLSLCTSAVAQDEFVAVADLTVDGFAADAEVVLTDADTNTKRYSLLLDPVTSDVFAACANGAVTGCENAELHLPSFDGLGDTASNGRVGLTQDGADAQRWHVVDEDKDPAQGPIIALAAVCLIGEAD